MSASSLVPGVSSTLQSYPVRPTPHHSPLPSTSSFSASHRPAATAVRSGDSAEISTQARARSLEQSKEPQPVRDDKVRSVRDQIEHGGYDSDAKLDAALDRMIASLDKMA